MLNCISIPRMCSARDWYFEMSCCLLGRNSAARSGTSHLAPFPKCLEYPSAHALTPPTSFINAFNCAGATLLRATYRNALAHLLMVLLSALSSLVQRMTAVNGSAFLSRQLSTFECVSQKLLCSSPNFVMFDNSEYGL